MRKIITSFLGVILAAWGVLGVVSFVYAGHANPLTGLNVASTKQTDPPPPECDQGAPDISLTVDNPRGEGPANALVAINLTRESDSSDDSGDTSETQRRERGSDNRSERRAGGPDEGDVPPARVCN